MLKRIDTKKTLAIIIGAAKYENLEYGSEEVKNIFERGVQNSTTRIAAVLTDELEIPASQVRVLEDPSTDVALRCLGEGAEAELDALVFYFCGHGIMSSGDLYLGFRELVLDKPQIGGALMREVLDLIGKINAKTKFIVLDCCFGGGGIEQLPANFSQTDLRSEINLLGSFAIASAGPSVRAIVPAGSSYTAFSGTVCDVIEGGIEFAGPLLSIDEFFREVRRRMIEANFPVPIRVSSIDDDLIALAPNRRFIPEDKQLRFRLNVMSERLQVYGRFFRQSNEAQRDSIRQLREQDLKFSQRFDEVTRLIDDLNIRVDSLGSMERKVEKLEAEKADSRLMIQRFSWVYNAIILSSIGVLLAGAMISFYVLK
jgi:hypothetical protein